MRAEIECGAESTRWAIAPYGCCSFTIRFVPSDVTSRTHTVALFQVLPDSISMSSALLAMTGKSERLYLAPSACEPLLHAQDALPAVTE